MTDAERPWGKINEGQAYNVITVDMARVYSHLKATIHERMILDFVRENTWGKAARGRKVDGRWPEPVPCNIPIKGLAEEWKLPANHLYAARAALVADGILIQIKKTFLPGKRVDSWPESRISQASREYAAAILKGPRSRTEKVHDHGVIHDRGVVHDHGPEYSAIADQTGTNPGLPHIRNAPASEDLRREEEKKDSQAGELRIMKAGGESVPAYAADDWGIDDDADLSGEIVAPLDSSSSLLATDPSDDTPESLPARVRSHDEREEERIKDWCAAIVLKTTGDDFQAEEIRRMITHWRSSGIIRKHIAAFVSEACLVNYPKIKERNVGVPRWVNGIFKKRQADPGSWPVPTIPAEWDDKPPPAPKVYRPSQDPTAMAAVKARESYLEAKQQVARIIDPAEAKTAKANVEVLRLRMLAAIDVRDARYQSMTPMEVAR